MDLQSSAAAMPRATHKSRRDYVVAGWASMAGTTIEWYDFFLYGTAAALVFNKVFFPSLDPVLGTMAAFATYGVGFIGRPMGGLIFGHFGDRIGRKSMLMATLLMMGIPSMAIGLIPSFQSIGYWAAGLLVAMRFIQGMAVGGEWGGAALMAVEHAPPGKKGLFGSFPQTGVGFGLILSSSAMAVVANLPEPALLSWGWRVPFLASVALLIIGWYIRTRVPESPDFEQLKQDGARVKSPVAAVIVHHRPALLAIIGARTAENTWFYLVVAFALSYAANQLKIPKAAILHAITAGAALSLFTMPLAGYLSDTIGQKRLFMIGLVVMCLFSAPFFSMLETRHAMLVWWAMVLGVGVVFPILYAPESQFFAAQFPAQVRYSGISVSVQMAGVLGGGIAPMIATALLAAGGGQPRYVVAYMIALGVIALLCAACLRDGREPRQAA
ncbi:MFS transporter [Burkholderia plantarii]|uniref:MFS transporter n=1 Tax=Burkholderia plantarii TaxID=41899 RepID=UPI0006D890AC|nr:MFS transporter [Burkholderia plantarii]ALK34286.1 major facilitator transporter [Burkholderia plantarii]